MGKQRRSGKNVVASGSLFTPEFSRDQQRSTITFGSYLPARFQSIEEEKEELQCDSDTQKLIQLEAYGVETSGPDLKPITTLEQVERLENRKAQWGKSLKYIPLSLRNGKKCVTIVEDDLNEIASYWKSVLIGLGYFVFRFDTEEECEHILHEGPYTFKNKPFVLQKWELNFEFNPDCITRIPLWVTLPGLPVGYWSKNALSKVTSMIGKPLHTDNFTADMTRISYAKILVEVDVAQPLLDNIDISTPYGEFQQSVVFDWCPKFYSSCMKFRHELSQCWNKIDGDVIEDEFQEKER
ncbi:hypothetical protein R3W88_029687 [Solanum pinnatisectum]|uniref:DUF4283 domain-containing protein n=1 Tax=Solanum pinnatisectum TaxID=50273 RepID=A0AAV9K9J8_9SOLN|nr:hypothetical protein R3W88_029687 [Solanum pinnatisectum]